jgi:hypothetical protein
MPSERKIGRIRSEKLPRGTARVANGNRRALLVSG